MKISIKYTESFWKFSDQIEYLPLVENTLIGLRSKIRRSPWDPDREDSGNLSRLFHLSKPVWKRDLIRKLSKVWNQCWDWGICGLENERQLRRQFHSRNAFRKMQKNQIILDNSYFHLLAWFDHLHTHCNIWKRDLKLQISVSQFGHHQPLELMIKYSKLVCFIEEQLIIDVLTKLSCLIFIIIFWNII